MSYIPKYFTTKELVHPDWYAMKGDRAIKWIPDIALKALDEIRAAIGAACTINDSRGLKNCGLRWYANNPYSKTSRHLQGLAFDLHFYGQNMEKIWYFLYENAWKFGIAVMEDWQVTGGMINKKWIITWIHVELGGILKEGEKPKVVGA